MMHYGFCRKHADQTGEGGCPECAMDHQQEEITALRAEVEALTASLDANWVTHQRVVKAESRVAELGYWLRILLHAHKTGSTLSPFQEKDAYAVLGDIADPKALRGEVGK